MFDFDQYLGFLAFFNHLDHRFLVNDFSVNICGGLIG